MRAAVAAVFDVDRTLLPGTTSERLFIARLWREGIIGGRQALASLRFTLPRLGPTLLAEWRAHRPYLAGADPLVIGPLARRCFEEEIRPRLARRGLERWRQHQAEGALTVLLSGSLALLIEPLRDELRGDVAIASHLRLANGRFVGRIDGPHPYGVVKARLVRQLAGERALDLAASYCYADHHSDVALLSLFGHPVCVNANTRLRAVARQRGWPVEEFA